MAMHIGAPARLVVKAGDTVKVGTLIGESGAGLSSPIYSSVSGTVKKIDEIIPIAGNHVPVVIIESDGEQMLDPDISPYEVNTKAEFIEALAKSGIVGLGGAGFPTPVKLAADNSRVDTLIINGAECEPYITSDTRTMLDSADDIAEGISLICKFLEIKNVIRIPTSVRHTVSNEYAVSGIPALCIFKHGYYGRLLDRRLMILLCKHGNSSTDGIAQRKQTVSCRPLLVHQHTVHVQLDPMGHQNHRNVSALPKLCRKSKRYAMVIILHVNRNLPVKCLHFKGLSSVFV